MSAELAGAQVTLSGLRPEGLGELSGQIKNIGAGGLYLVTDQPVKVYEVFRCAIPFSELPLAIPTFLVVRWVRENAGLPQYQVGMQFLL